MVEKPWRPNDYIARLPQVKALTKARRHELLHRAGRELLAVLESDREPTASIVMGWTIAVVALALVFFAVVVHAPIPS